MSDKNEASIGIYANYVHVCLLGLLDRHIRDHGIALNLDIKKGELGVYYTLSMRHRGFLVALVPMVLLRNSGRRSCIVKYWPTQYSPPKLDGDDWAEVLIVAMAQCSERITGTPARSLDFLPTADAAEALDRVASRTPAPPCPDHPLSALAFAGMCLAVFVVVALAWSQMGAAW